MKKNPITTLLLAFALLLNPLLADEAAATNAALLREALFAEEADRNLAKAEKGYREIIKNFDTDRVYAATAILRLAEILHQRGDTAEAEQWFARVLREFPDQDAIAKVAVTRLGDKATGLVDIPSIQSDPQTEQVKRITKLLKESPDLLNTPHDGTTLLASAAAQGQLKVIEFLLSNGARIDGDNNFPSALSAAVENGQAAVVARLIKAKAKLKTGLLNFAVRSGNYAISEMLLKAGADPNSLSSLHLSAKEVHDYSSSDSVPTPSSSDDLYDPFASPQQAEVRTPENVSGNYREVYWTPLEIATFFRFAKLTDLLLTNGAKSLNHDHDFTEDLRFAIIDQNTELIAKLLKNGANPNSSWLQNSERLSALSLAASIGNGGIIKQLIEAGASVKTTVANEKNAPLFYATGPTVDLLLAAGADPNRKNKQGFTPLLGVKDPAKAKALLQGGADLNFLIELGYSPLSRANPEVLDVLLATKPDLSNFVGTHTILGLVSGESKNPSQVERIAKLIAAGADPNQVDKNGTTPLLLAVSNFNIDCVNVLIKGGAKPNGVPNTPVPLNILPSSRTKRSQKLEPIVRALVDAGANPDTLDSNNETILRKAAKWNELETVRYLMKKGAALQKAGKFAFTVAHNGSTAKSELFLATYQQPEYRQGLIQIVDPRKGHIYAKVAAITPLEGKLPPCPHSILETFAFSHPDFKFAFGEVTIWRAGKTEPLKYHLREIIATGDPTQDATLQWGDIVQFSIAKTQEERTTSQVEKEFLTKHLRREVKIVIEGKTNKIALEPIWQKLANPGSWMLKGPDRNPIVYTQETKSLPLVPLHSLPPLVPTNEAHGSFKVAVIQSVKRNGQELEALKDRDSNFWFEPNDTIHLKVNRSGPDK